MRFFLISSNCENNCLVLFNFIAYLIKSDKLNNLKKMNLAYSLVMLYRSYLHKLNCCAINKQKNELVYFNRCRLI